MILYRISKYETTIQEVESERQSKSSVFINGGRQGWNNGFYSYHKSRSEAKETILKRVNHDLVIAQSKVLKLKSDLEKANLL